MSVGDLNGWRMGEGEPLDDALVEDLLAGRYEGDAPDLVALGQQLRKMRSLGDGPAPPPSPALAQLLQGSAPARDGSRLLHRMLAAAAAVSVILAAMVGAGSARVLPGPAQSATARIVRAATPFELPPQGGPGAAPSNGPSGEPAQPTDPDQQVQGDPLPPGPGEGATSESRRVDPAGANSSPPTGPADRAPTPRATSTLPPVRTAPDPDEPFSPGVDDPAPPQPRPLGFSADLSGAIAAPPGGRGTAVLVANPGRHELCLTLVVTGLAPVTAAHLHEGSLGVSGPVAATFGGLTSGFLAQCVTVDDLLLRTIHERPETYYVDVHSTELAIGALRGQLGRVSS